MSDCPEGHPTYLYGISGRLRKLEGSWSTWETVVPPHGQIFSSGICLGIDESWNYLITEDYTLQFFMGWRRNPGETWRWKWKYLPGKDNTCEYPQLTLSESIAHVGWITNLTHTERFSARYVRHEGETGLHARVLEAVEGHSLRHMSIACDGELVVACWAKMEGDLWEVFWRRSTDGGFTWSGQAEPLSSSGVGAWQPDVAVFGERIYVAWEDYRNGNAEIYGKLSSDSGVTWSKDFRITHQESFSIKPEVAALKSRAYVVWQDFRDGNWEIYGARFPFLTSENREDGI
jgi:hypothetical protein